MNLIKGFLKSNYVYLDRVEVFLYEQSVERCCIIQAALSDRKTKRKIPSYEIIKGYVCGRADAILRIWPRQLRPVHLVPLFEASILLIFF